MAPTVYLVQHGKAKPEAEDPTRPLTDEGRTEVTRVAQYVASLGLAVDRILHSGKLRARQTAEIFAQALSAPVEAAEGLAPLDDPAAAAERIEQAPGPIMVVGHLPHLSRLTARLLGVEREPVRFRMAGIVCLQKETAWQVVWILTPETVR